MSDERKPSEDLKEGLGLVFRAARTMVKQVDVSAIDKGLDKAISRVTRVATAVGRAVSDEFNRGKPSSWHSEEEKQEASMPSEEHDGESGNESK